MPRYGYGYGGNSCGSGCCNFPQLIILILILLQFSNKGSLPSCGCEQNKIGGIDKGIIFIITLYYLSCCSPCRSQYY